MTALMELMVHIKEIGLHEFPLATLELITELQKKEKQQIVKAFEDGNDLGQKGRLPSGEGYYKQKYLIKKK